MDDLALLREMGQRTPLPDQAERARARARLMAAIAQEPVAPVPLAAARGRRRRRLAISGATVIGLAAAITGVVSLGALEPVGVGPAPASAGDILRQAATAARSQPDTPPRPDQFVYTRTRLGDGSTREAWLSADGSRDGLVKQHGEDLPLPGCRDGRQQVFRGSQPLPGVVEPCEPHPAYQADLPTDAAGIRQYLENASNGGDKVNSLGKDIHFLVSEGYIRPAALAALLEAVAGMDGLRIVPDAKDGAGRSGIGVSWTHRESTATLVFDQRTHAFLGLSGETAVVVRQAVVDNAGQQP